MQPLGCSLILTTSFRRHPSPQPAPQASVFVTARSAGRENLCNFDLIAPVNPEFVVLAFPDTSGRGSANGPRSHEASNTTSDCCNPCKYAHALCRVRTSSSQSLPLAAAQRAPVEEDMDQRARFEVAITTLNHSSPPTTPKSLSPTVTDGGNGNFVCVGRQR